MYADSIRCDVHGSTFTVHTPTGHAGVRLALLGPHQVANALTALTSIAAAGHDVLQAAAGLETLACVPGRLERVEADHGILGLVEHIGRTAGSEAANGTLVVTDDRELAAGVRRLGARTAGTAWLLGRLARPSLSAPSVGNRRPPTTPASDDERDPWQPGRGATTKRGNPRRRRRSSGSMPT